MPFSSLKDPVDLARAQGALEAAWSEIQSAIPEERADEERTRLVYIIAALAAVAGDEQELKERALDRYRQWYSR